MSHSQKEKSMTNIPPLTLRLTREDREALLSHFLSLDAENRRLRFGNSIADSVVKEYIARLDFVRDGLFAVRDGDGRIVAAAHVAVGAKYAELGLSVSEASARAAAAGRSSRVPWTSFATATSAGLRATASRKTRRCATSPRATACGSCRRDRKARELRSRFSRRHVPSPGFGSGAARPSRRACVEESRGAMEARATCWWRLYSA
jgi:hypothetical protein